MTWKAGLPEVIYPADFERMKILARSQGFELPTKKAVWRILWLADTFRAILRESDTRTIIRRGLEVAENRQSKNGPAVKRGQADHSG